MAVSARFEADFSSFLTAVDQAEVKLVDFQSGAGRVEASLSRMVDNFSGRKVIQDATLMAEAVERVGGVSQLTEAEMVRVATKVQEASDKFRAMGQDVPPKIQEIADATSRVLPPTDALGKSWVLRIAEGQLLRDAVREVISAVKDMIEFLPELAIKGAVVGDVEEAFKHLSSEAGLTANVLLTTLRSGTHGTIDDFLLMQRANKDLAAGLDLSNAQFGTLAQGAFALAKATGGSAKDALDSMSDAMVTGRAKAIALITGKVDLKKAEEDYAVSLGGTKENLTAEGKLEADRQAILSAVQAGLARVGVQQDSLKDKVEQSKVAWQNFTDEFGKQIAMSPVIAAGFDSIRASLASAFGPDQQKQIAGLAAVVDNLAIKVVDVGIGTGLVAGEMVQAWGLISLPIIAVEQAVVGLSADLVSLVEVAAGIAAKIPGLGSQFAGVAATTKDWGLQARAMAADLHQQFIEAEDTTAGVGQLNKTIDAGVGTLVTMRDAMLDASSAHAAGVKPLTDVAGATDAAAGSTKTHAAYLQQSAAEAKAYADAIKNLNAVGTTWQQTLAGINPGLVEDIKQMLLAGASAKDLEVAWGILPSILKAVGDSIKDDTEAVKKQRDAVLEVTKLWDEYSEIVATGNETAYERAQNAIDKWYDDLIAKNQKAKTDTTEFYDAIAALDDKKYQRLEANRLADDTRTREHLVRLATVAQEEYDFMLAHSSSFTADQINKQRDVADAAQLAAATWGTGFVQAAATVAGAIKGIPPVAKAAIDALRSFSIDPSTLSPEIGGTQGAPGSFQYEAWQQLRGIFTNNLPPAARAGGGPVDAGMSYLVGEQGPELFTPSSSGSISPDGAGGMNITINVTQPLGTPQQIASVVGPALLAAYRGQGGRIVSGA